ncbi:MAG: transmembrane 220 family protein [Gammaproteobacteria bacterium]|nr:transmembrane 220 family protein [Gammaproteobacteria bacterium]
MIFRFFSILMSVLFSYAILVQFNDSDSLFWIALYGISLVVGIAGIVNIQLKGLLWIAMGIYLAAIAWLSPNFANTSLEAFAAVGMKGESEELVRELWGMVICAVWIAVVLLHDGLIEPFYQNVENDEPDTEEALCN